LKEFSGPGQTVAHLVESGPLGEQVFDGDINSDELVKSEVGVVLELDDHVDLAVLEGGVFKEGAFQVIAILFISKRVY